MGARIRHGFHKASARPWRQHLELQWRLPPPGKWNLFLSCAKLESSFDLAVMDPPGVCPHLFSGRKVSSPCCCSGATELAIVFNWTKEDQFQKNLLDDGTVYIYILYNIISPVHTWSVSDITCPDQQFTRNRRSDVAQLSHRGLPQAEQVLVVWFSETAKSYTAATGAGRSQLAVMLTVKNESHRYEMIWR